MNVKDLPVDPEIRELLTATLLKVPGDVQTQAALAIVLDEFRDRMLALVVAPFAVEVRRELRNQAVTDLVDEIEGLSDTESYLD